MIEHLRAQQRASRHRRFGPVAVAIALLVVLMPPANAEPAARSGGVSAPAAQRADGLFSGARLQRMIGVELEVFSTLDRLDRLGALSVDAGFRQAKTDDVERAVRRVGRDRLADQLVESLDLEMRLDRWLGRAPRSAASAPTAGTQADQRRWAVDLGVRHAMPRLELQRATARGELRLSLAPDGRAGLRFRGARRERTEFAAGFDGESRFHVSCAVGF